MMNSLYDQIFEACQPYWHARDNDLHIPESYRYAQELLQHYPAADPEIVLPAVLMHDNGYATVPKETLFAGLIDSPIAYDTDITRLHEIEGAKIARQILTKIEYAYPAEKVDIVCDIIDGHDSREEALSLEDMLVKDADKMWRFTLSGVKVASQWMKLEPLPFIDYCLGRIEKWFFTETGKELAQTAGAITRQHLETPLRGVCFMLIKDGHVLAERRKQSKKLLPGVMAIPGGHCEDGETAEETLVRELQEELAVELVMATYVCTLHHRAEEFRRLDYYAVTDWRGKIENHEAAALEWIPFEHLAALDLDVDQLAVKEYLHVYR